jgi:hypothetical protein
MKRIIYLLLTLVLFSCEKETYQYFYIPDSVKAWGLYQVGSYWIYKDEDTGQLDSVYVYDVKRTTEDEVSDKLHHRIYESFHVFFRNSNSETKISYLENSYNGYSSVGNIKFKEHFSFYFRDFKPVTYKINNIIYSEVDSLIDESNNEIWVAKNNWIVKQRIHTDSINFSMKTLIRSKIIQ